MDEPGDERRDPTLRSAFDRAVEQAAEIASQSVARIHRRRLVTQTAIASALAALAIMSVVAVLLHNDAVQQAHSNAVYNCKLFRRAAGIMGDFVKSDVKLRVDQNRTGLTKKLVTGFSKVVPASVIREAASRNLALLRAAVNEWEGDAARLVALAETDCVKGLGG